MFNLVVFIAISYVVFWGLTRYEKEKIDEELKNETIKSPMDKLSSKTYRKCLLVSVGWIFYVPYLVFKYVLEEMLGSKIDEYKKNNKK